MQRLRRRLWNVKRANSRLDRLRRSVLDYVMKIQQVPREVVLLQVPLQDYLDSINRTLGLPVVQGGEVVKFEAADVLDTLLQQAKMTLSLVQQRSAFQNTFYCTYIQYRIFELFAFVQ